ncbi:hypothetical protein HPP92_029069 [Vanilla planifolia]|uniref:Uncharacterized protein n=1 Tax=Vanilla planifolia TaxID=51239 RepID=A0A835P511_VANPL|nr:hypothetical protein HPP92_029058 [Vanilla planifolia]KAG0445982.1 hypothetical protein HPP92_029069 [Vanilla planifolia]
MAREGWGCEGGRLQNSADVTNSAIVPHFGCMLLRICGASVTEERTAHHPEWAKSAAWARLFNGP